MAGEIQLNSTTMATESSGIITLSNVDSDTNRTNLGLGSMATQNANAVALTGGSLTGTEIDLKSSGTTLYASNGSTSLMSESSGTVTVDNVTIGSSVVFPQTGFAQLTLSGSISGSSSSVDIPWDTITGDTTNITQSGHDVTLVLPGIYLISFTANFSGTDAERQAYIGISQTSDDTVLASARDSVSNFDSGSNYGSATCTVVKSVSANFQIYFSFKSLSDGTANLYLDSHASIVLVKPA